MIPRFFLSALESALQPEGPEVASDDGIKFHQVGRRALADALAVLATYAMRKF